MFIIISRFDCNPLHFAYFLSDSQSPFSSSSCLVAPLLLCFSFLMLWMAPACEHNYLPIVWNHFSNRFLPVYCYYCQSWVCSMILLLQWVMYASVEPRIFTFILWLLGLSQLWYCSTFPDHLEIASNRVRWIC